MPQIGRWVDVCRAWALCGDAPARSRASTSTAS